MSSETSKIATFECAQVQFIPKQLSPGVLYVSEEYMVAVHLCACGCGNKVTTPLGPAEWSFERVGGRPSLYPSVGNWELPCQSHYVINEGKVEWYGKWSRERVLAGRQSEADRRIQYFEGRRHNEGVLSRLRRWLFSWFE